MEPLIGIFVVLGVALSVLWVVMPFVIFRMKDLLRDILRQQRITNEYLSQIDETTQVQTWGEGSEPGMLER